MILRKKVTGSLNSKSPNPFELAYKELWDKLEPWKKEAFSQENADDRCTSLHSDFLKQVSHRADELYAAMS